MQVDSRSQRGSVVGAMGQLDHVLDAQVTQDQTAFHIRLDRSAAELVFGHHRELPQSRGYAALRRTEVETAVQDIELGSKVSGKPNVQIRADHKAMRATHVAQGIEGCDRKSIGERSPQFQSASDGLRGGDSSKQNSSRKSGQV